MRGHICDMDALMAICDAAGVKVIEDCAHTMGAHWNGTPSGRHGVMAAYSTQTYKHINSGEGGLLTTNDPMIAARAIIMSGSYMLYGSHGAAPDEEVFRQVRLDTPNYSGRMDNLRATILRGQLKVLENNIRRWNRLNSILSQAISLSSHINVPERAQHEEFVGSSIQFRPNLDQSAFDSLIANCAKRGVDIKWFGAPVPKAFTSRYDSWHYLGKQPALPNTLHVLSQTCDLRIPLTFDDEDCQIIAQIVMEEVAELA